MVNSQIWLVFGLITIFGVLHRLLHTTSNEPSQSFQVDVNVVMHKARFT